MSDDPNAPEEEGDKKPSKMPLLIGVVLALVGGGGGFFAVSSGLILAPEEVAMEPGEDGEGTNGEEMSQAENVESLQDDAAIESAEDVSFVELEAIVVALPPGSTNTHLRFKAELEVRSGHEEHVTTIAPRVIDVLNGYLRAVELADLEDHRAFPRLRAQMLRRVQVVAGADAVQNILIQEFILN